MTAFINQISPVDPFFSLASQKDLRLGSQYETREVWRYLSATLSRNPSDLRAHVQRIYLAWDSEDPELTFAALVDIFLILGKKGHDLRAMLLESSEPYIANEHYLYLQSHLVSGLDTNLPLPATTSSLFDLGLAGSVHLIQKQRAILPNNSSNVLAEAISLLDDDQVEAAQTLLEKDLYSNADNPEVETLLLEIYRRSRNQTAFLDMKERLRATGRTMSRVWETSLDD